VALRIEARSVVSCRPSRVTEEVIRLPQGTLLQLSGIGDKQAGVAAEGLLAEGADSLLSWGVAGGLDPKLLPGSLILPRAVIGADQSVFHPDAAWHERLCRRLHGRIDFHIGALAHSSAVLIGRDEKIALLRCSGAIAVDTESAAVAQVAQEAGVPFMAVRAVVDPPDLTIPASALASLDAQGRLRPLRLLAALAQHPGELVVLIRLGLNFRAAQAALRKATRLAGEKLLAPEQAGVV
jgi:adenosylhomocysteine nucleosidase